MMRRNPDRLGRRLHRNSNFKSLHYPTEAQAAAKQQELMRRLPAGHHFTVVPVTEGNLRDGYVLLIEKIPEPGEENALDALS